MKIDGFHLVFLKVLSIFMLSIAPLLLFAQSFSKKDLIGKWQSVNAANPTEMIFADSTTLYFKGDGTPALNNTPLAYSVDSLNNHSLLLIHFPTGFTMKCILWIKSKDEFRMFSVDVMNYKDPLKEIPDEGNKKVIKFKRSGNVI